MGVTFTCDGCGDPVTEATKVGRLDPAYYCAGCLIRWRSVAQRRAELEAESAAQFESQWTALRETARTILAKLPDDA